CNPLVYENLGRIALGRGPLMYCFEEVDNTGFDVWDLLIPEDATLRAEWVPNLLDGVTVIRGEGYVQDSDWKQDSLYTEIEASSRIRKVSFTAIPYYAWANREPGAMCVWARLMPKTV
ncbi:MAG: glycoside hydrolase family 127 protein, partial [Thermoproteota archaeon]